MRLRVEYEPLLVSPARATSAAGSLSTVRTHMDALERLDDETCAALLKGITSSDADELEYKSLGNEETRLCRVPRGRRRSALFEKNELEQRRRRDDIEATNYFADVRWHLQIRPRKRKKTRTPGRANLRRRRRRRLREKKWRKREKTRKKHATKAFKA